MKITMNGIDGKLIGLCGYATSGKDSVADWLVKDFGYVKFGWADRLYGMTLCIDPVVWSWNCFPQKLSRLVDKVGWTEAKKIPFVRKYLQWLGTSVVRGNLSEDAFVHALVSCITKKMREGVSVVVTNCRFPNELQAIEKLGGILVWVDRPGVSPINSHVSEWSVDQSQCTFRVDNDGTLDDLRLWAERLNAAVKGTHHNRDVHVELYSRTVKRAIASGVKYVLETAAPASAELEAWMSRHRIDCGIMDDGVEVYIDGERAGRVRYSDNVIEIDTVIAR